MFPKILAEKIFNFYNDKVKLLSFWKKNSLSQAEKDKYFIISLICGLLKKKSKTKNPSS